MKIQFLLFVLLCSVTFPSNMELFAAPLQRIQGRAQTDGDQKTKVKPKAKLYTRIENTPTWTDPETAAKESTAFKLMGEYLHQDKSKAIQVVPVDKRFYLSIYSGGLPGAGWDGGEIEHQWVGATDIQQRLAGWEKIDRSAKLDFPEPPLGALVLFDGTDTKQWASGKLKDGLLQAGARSKRKFRDFELHFETMVPFKPEYPLGHPDRGNSGVLALGAYEVQVCDTFGVDFDSHGWEQDGVLKTADTWCGSIYGIRAASFNMCLPPLSWQSFDVKFTAARFKNDLKVSDARMTVRHNGVLIHDDVVLPRGTGGSPKRARQEVAEGPIYIQNHRNPTQYRNIWVIPRGYVLAPTKPASNKPQHAPDLR